MTLRCHLLLRLFVLDPKRLGPSLGFSRSPLGQLVTGVVLSHDAMAAVMGAIYSAPSRPPLPALDPYLLQHIGLNALEDAPKILAGRVLRQAIEFLGGQHIRTDVRITVMSIFAYGSIYRLRPEIGGKPTQEDRRKWTEGEIERLKQLPKDDERKAA
jgi:hypothetical protein